MNRNEQIGPNPTRCRVQAQMPRNRRSLGVAAENGPPFIGVCKADGVKMPSSGLATGARRVWTINGDFLALRPTGVARYAREVTLALDALVTEAHPLADGLELDILAPRGSSEPFALQKIPLRIVPEFNRPRLPQLWVQAQLPFYVKGGLLSFCNLAPVITEKQIVCIHDLHTTVAPESYGRLFRWMHRVVLPILGRRARLVTTVSTLSRELLIRYGVAPAEKIVVTYNGSDHVTRWNPKQAKLHLETGRPFILCLGRSHRFKNMELVLRMAQALDQTGLDIYIAGDMRESVVRQYHPETPANVRLLGRISDDDLAKLLSLALCFVFPSRIEGFGLPAVEAMALGCPVIASSAPCLPEICGDAALYADPDNTAGWIAAIQRVQLDSELRRQMTEKGCVRARYYSWRRVAETYLNLMAHVDCARIPGSNSLQKEARYREQATSMLPISKRSSGARRRMWF